MTDIRTKKNKGLLVLTLKDKPAIEPKECGIIDTGRGRIRVGIVSIAGKQAKVFFEQLDGDEQIGMKRAFYMHSPDDKCSMEISKEAFQAIKADINDNKGNR